MLPMTPMPSGADEGEAVGGMSKKSKLLESGPASVTFLTSRARGVRVLTGVDVLGIPSKMDWIGYPSMPGHWRRTTTAGARGRSGIVWSSQRGPLATSRAHVRPPKRAHEHFSDVRPGRGERNIALLICRAWGARLENRTTGFVYIRPVAAPIHPLAVRFPIAMRPTIDPSSMEYRRPAWRTRRPRSVRTSEQMARCRLSGDAYAVCTRHALPRSAVDAFKATPCQ
jgi:hypothetical protein